MDNKLTNPGSSEMAVADDHLFGFAAFKKWWASQSSTEDRDRGAEECAFLHGWTMRGNPRSEESYHPEPPEGCICGFMAQVTAPGCPVCQPNV